MEYSTVWISFKSPPLAYSHSYLFLAEQTTVDRIFYKDNLVKNNIPAFLPFYCTFKYRHILYSYSQLSSPLTTLLVTTNYQLLTRMYYTFYLEYAELIFLHILHNIDPDTTSVLKQLNNKLLINVYSVETMRVGSELTIFHLIVSRIINMQFGGFITITGILWRCSRCRQ